MTSQQAIQPPTVSVIIPTFNRAHTLPRAIKSVLAQSYQNFELIVIDDGSTDETASVFQDYPYVQYFYQKNKGVSAARNHGLKIAQGKYICFLDSDDAWHKNKLEKQLNIFENDPELQACYTDETWIRNGKHFNQHKKHKKYSGWIFEKTIPLCIISPTSIMLNKSVFSSIGDFDESLPACEDYDLWLRLSLHYPIHFIPEQLITKYGGHQDQLSRLYWGMDRFRVYALEKILKQTLTRQQKSAVLNELKRKYNILKLGAKKRRKYIFWLYCAFRGSNVINNPLVKSIVH